MGRLITSLLETAQVTTLLHNFLCTAPASGRPRFGNGQSNILWKSPCSWTAELDYFPSPAPFHMSSCKGFCSTHFPWWKCFHICFHIYAFIRLQTSLYWASNFLSRATGTSSCVRNVGVPRHSLAGLMFRVCLWMGIEIHSSDLKEGEKAESGQGGRDGCSEWEHYGTSCRKLRHARWFFWKAILCPDSASHCETKFYMSPLLLYSQLCSGITSLDTLSKAICTQCRWSTCFLHGQNLFFISCKQWK